MAADLSVRDRVMFGFLLVLGLMVVVAVLVGLQFARVSRLSSYISGELNDQISASQQVMIGINRENSGLRGYTLTGERRFQNDYRGGIEQRRAGMVELRRVLTDTSDRSKLARLEAQCAELDSVAEQVLEFAAQQDASQAYQYHQANMRPLSANATATAVSISEAGHNRLRQVNKELTAGQARARVLYGLLLLAALVLLAATAVATSRSVGRPAAALASAARAIQDGDYGGAGELISKSGLAIEHDRNGSPPRSEIARIAAAVRDMSETLEGREKTLLAHSQVRSACASSIDPTLLAELSLPEIARHTGSQIAALYVVGSGRLAYLAGYGVTPAVAQGVLSEPGAYVQQAAQSGQPVFLSDIPAEGRFVIETGLGDIAPRSIASLPLVANKKTIGVVCLGSMHPFREREEELLLDSAAQLSIALSNALQHSQVRDLVDELAATNEQLNEQNEELQSQNEEIQSQNEEIETQNEELLAQSTELQERNSDLESRTRDLSALQALTAVALSTLEQNDLLAGLVQAVCSHSYLQFGLVLLPDEDGQTLRIAVSHNLGDVLPEQVEMNRGLHGLVAQSRAVQISTECERDLGPLGLVSRAPETRMLVGLPLLAADRLYGVAILGSTEPREFTPSEQQLLRVFASRAAVGVERAQAFERLQRAEERERSDRLRVQAIIDNLPEGVVIASGPEGVLESANRAALALYGIDEVPNIPWPEHPTALNLCRPNGEPLDPEEVPLTRSLLKGEHCVAEEVLIRQPSGREVIALCNTIPMRGRAGEIIGAVGVFRDITSIKRQQVLLQQVVERERKIAETLQKSFLPSAVPIVPGYEIGHAYLPAQQGAQVGGDFYDLIELGPDRIGIVMGDVSGKGVSAAVYTAMAKYMLRAFAHEHGDPAEVMCRLNDAMTRYESAGVFVTLFFGILHTSERRLVYCNGGHELPLRVECTSGRCLPLVSTGPAVGVLTGARYFQTEVVMDEGDILVMFTDGITEARRGKEFLGTEGLEKILSENSSAGAHEMTRSIIARVHDYAGDSFADDVALVVIKSSNGVANVDE